jgi:Flp pilus assembly protein TadG
MKSERGQSLVEFALTLPMLLVVMFMVTEFGRALYQYNVLAQATREGARVAVVAAESAASGDGEARMTDFLVGTGINAGDLSELSCTVVDDYNASGTKVVIATAELPFRWILQGDLPTNPGGAAVVSPNALTLRAQTVMKAETF